MRYRLGSLLFCFACTVVAQTGPLHTSGRFIVDRNGQRVKLAAVNWYGAEEQDFVVAGLDRAPLAQIAHLIRTLGFNAVRLPWSNQMYETNLRVADARLSANPTLQGSRALDVFDAVIAALAAEGLYVILDNHTSNADWCCSNTDGNGFWYNAAYPESSWLADWQGIAARYAGQPAVIGADLRNEPRGPLWGGSDARYDWHGAAERGGNSVLGANPNLLIFVEGVNYAADLTGVRNLPVRLNLDQRLVYSSHDYSWFHNGVATYNSLKTSLDSNWGVLTDSPIGVPVWVGEFGTCHTSTSCVASTAPADSGFWFAAFRRYLQERDLDWSYWALNGTQATGTGRTFGAEETFGILNRSWTGAASATLLNALQAVSVPAVAPTISAGGVVNPATFQAHLAVAPGGLASVFGSNLAPVTTVAAAFPAPTALGGGQILMNTGAAVPILFASPGQINIQIPWETDSSSAASLTATVGILASGPETVPLAAASPVIFMQPESRQGAVVISNTTVIAGPARPAHPGEYISIYCTGLGAVTNQPATGYPAPAAPLAGSIVTPTVKIGNAAGKVSFAGLTPGFVGLYQVDVQVPADAPAGDQVPLSIAIAGVESNMVTIAIR
jgi:endoglucanase